MSPARTPPSATRVRTRLCCTGHFAANLTRNPLQPGGRQRRPAAAQRRSRLRMSVKKTSPSAGGSCQMATWLRPTSSVMSMSCPVAGRVWHRVPEAMRHGKPCIGGNHGERGCDQAWSGVVVGGLRRCHCAVRASDGWLTNLALRHDLGQLGSYLIQSRFAHQRSYQLFAAAQSYFQGDTCLARCWCP